MRPHVYYNNKDKTDFQKALRQAVDSYFQTTGQSIKGNWLMYLKAAVFFTWMAVGYVLLLTSDQSWEVIVNYLIFGFGAMLFAISVAHDASHQAMFRQPWLNRLFSYSWNLIGLSTYFWELKHHEGHHNITNVIEYDSDVAPSKLIRLHPKAEYLWFHKYQNWYVYLLYALFGPITIFIREFRFYPVKEYGNTTVQHPPFTLLRLIIMKLGYLTLVLGIPLWLIPQPVGVILAGFLIMAMVCGFYIILILAVPHVTTYSYFKTPNTHGMLDNNWYTHTLDTTLDCSPGSRLLNWFAGGLNTHVAHHIFPNICHIHYYRLAPIIEKVAGEYGVGYRKASVWQALKGHFAWISELRHKDEKSERQIITASEAILE